MQRFTLPRDLYHGKGSLEALKTFEGKKAIVCVGGGSMKRNGFLDRAVDYLKEAGMDVELFEGIEPDPSVETVMKGAAVMEEFQPDWIIAIGGGSPIDAAKAIIDASGVNNLKDLSKEDKEKLKTIANEAAAIINVSLVFKEDSVEIYKNGKLIENVYFYEKLSNTGNQLNLVGIAPVAIFALATVVFLARKSAKVEK